MTTAQLNREVASNACRNAFQRGGTSSLPNYNNTDPRGIVAATRSFAILGGGRFDIVRRDTTLPTALALFDQRRFTESLDWFQKANRKLPLEAGGD